MIRAVIIWVPGRPATKGSWKCIGRAKLVPANPRLKGWAKNVALEARKEWAGRPTTRPVSVDILYYLKRPKSDYGTGRNAHKLKANVRKYPAARRDGDKMERAIWDALEGVVYLDDRQVVRWSGEKRFTDQYIGDGFEEGASITIEVLEDDNEDR